MKKNLKYYIHRMKRNFKQPIGITDACIACGKCVKTCPMPNCITKGTQYGIDSEMCMRCGKCIDSCPVGAIVRLDG
ncbi:MAG: 4Fe-4S binding protein [Rikenellaceae bacterium]